MTFSIVLSFNDVVFSKQATWATLIPEINVGKTAIVNEEESNLQEVTSRKGMLDNLNDTQRARILGDGSQRGWAP